MPKKCLFADDVEEGDELQINSSYAHHYEQWRRKELIQKLKDRHGEPHSSQTAVESESSSESSSDDEYCEPDNPEFNRDFLRALGALQAKGVQALKEQDFFATDYSIKKKEKEEKPMTLKDYERHIIVERGGKLEDDDESGPIIKQEKSQGESSAKSELMKAFHDDSEDSDDDGGLLKSGLFKVKEDSEKTKRTKFEADADVVNFLKGKATQLDKSEDATALQTLKEKWNDQKLSKKDKWLADFFLNQRYLEDEDETIERAYNEVAIDEETISDDEKTLEKMDAHDHTYRFRFEEPDKDFIRKYPRNIDNSVRTQNNKRKEERQAYEQRKKEEKEQKRQEIAQLKALKYQEIKSKIEKIKEVSGNDDIDIANDELEEDFDPAAHDAKMANMFGEDYYDVEADQDKPMFSDDDEDLKDYDQWLDEAGPSAAGGGAGLSDGGGTGTEDGDEGEYWGEEDFNMDADYDSRQAKEKRQQEVMASSSRINRRRRSKFAIALKKKKPVFDPVEKDFDEYFDEYYNLDFEDIVGGMPCRFKYRKVEPNNFGLSTEDILNATVQDLNKWVAIRKIIRYDRTSGMEKQEKFNYERRANAVHIKQKILPSLFKFNPEDAQREEEEKKRQKNLKKKLRKQKKLEEEAAILGYANVEEEQAQMEEECKAAGEDENANEGDANTEEQNPNISEQVVEDGENGHLDQAETNTDKKKKKKKKKKSKHNEMMEGTEEVKEEGQAMEVAATTEQEAHNKEDDDSQRLKRPLEDTWESRPKKKHARQEGYGEKKRKDLHKKHKKHQDSRAPKEENSQVDTYFSGISDARLAAYGANPKKIKGKARYGKTDIF